MKTERELQEYIGDWNQLMPVRESVLQGGRQQGVRCVELSNGAGLDLTLLPDRCMDFYQLRFQGRSLNYLSPSGIVAPTYYEPSGGQWLRAFFGGFLTTCGFDNIGSDCMDQGEPLGIHGRLSSTPAELISIRRELRDGVPAVVVSGTMRQAVLFGCNLTLTRTVCCRYSSPTLEFTDVIENEGFRTVPYLLLYHFNMGFPLLDENAVLSIPSSSVRPRTEHARAHLADWNKLAPPADGFEEMCYYHDLPANSQGRAAVSLANPVWGHRLTLEFDAHNLDHFVQWKMLGKGEYVLGLEPCNATINGRADARENGSLKFLEPGGRVTNRFEITVD